MEQSKITLKSIKLDKNKVTYNYEALGEWRDYFKLENDFFIEYDEDISNVPYSILVIPFLCNFLPIAWVFDGEINVEECDKDFYLSIPEFKKGYIEMYPMIKFLGNLNVKNIKENKNAEKDDDDRGLWRYRAD